MNTTIPVCIPVRYTEGDFVGDLVYHWPFDDGSGKVLGYTARYDNQEEDKKVIPFFKPNGNRFKMGYPEGKRHLFGLQSLKDPRAWVYIPEGEKCESFLRALGVQSVTWPGGANAVELADWSVMVAFLNICILPDNDEHSEKAAHELARLLASLPGSREIRIARVAKDLGPGADVVDLAKQYVPDWNEFDPPAPESVPMLREVVLTSIEANIEPVPPEWLQPDRPAPLPLRRTAPPMERYPVDALPGVLRDAVLAIHESIQAPVAMCAQSVLSTAALAVQAHADVLVDGRRIPMSVWFLTIGVTGERKTAVDNQALWPVRTFEDEKREDYARAMNDYINETAGYKSAHARAARKWGMGGDPMATLGEPPKAPLQPVLRISDCTIEGLYSYLGTGWPSVGLFSSEGGLMVGGYGFNEENILKSLAGLSELWDGGRVARMRKGDGISLLVGRRLSLHLMLQPVAASMLMGSAVAEGQGFLTRTLTVWPDTTRGTRLYREHDLSADIRMKRYGKTILDLLRTPLPLVSDSGGHTLNPRTVTLEPEAKRTWIAFHDHVETQNGPGGDTEAVAGLANKIPEHALRLAGVFTLVEDASLDDVSRETMDNAIELAEWYLKEGLRLQGAASVTPELLLAEQALEWMRKQGGEIPMRHLYQYGPYRLRDAESARRIVRILEKHGQIEKVSDAKRETWRVVSDGLQGLSEDLSS